MTLAASSGDEGIKTLEEAAGKELARIEPVVSQLTGQTSRWSGNVVIVPGTEYKGTKSYGCDIRLAQGRQTRQERWRTMIHEMLHAHSEGYNRKAYEDYTGWEEGVVEKLQRLLRPRILEQLGVSVDERRFAAEEVDHDYNVYIGALERMRTLIEEDEEPFYLNLLSLPIAVRARTILLHGMQLPGERGVSFRKIFEVENGILKTNVNILRRLGR